MPYVVPFAAGSSIPSRARQLAQQGLAPASGMAVGVLGGFVAALLRRRPPTSYATSLRQPVATQDPAAATDEGEAR